MATLSSGQGPQQLSFFDINWDTDDQSLDSCFEDLHPHVAFNPVGFESTIPGNTSLIPDHYDGSIVGLVDQEEVYFDGPAPHYIDDVQGSPDTSSFQNPVVEEWTDEDIMQLHLYLLDMTVVTMFKSTTRTSSRTEMFNWMMRDEGRGKNAAPFSFNACCHFGGYDSDDLRELLLERAEDTGAITE